MSILLSLESAASRADTLTYTVTGVTTQFSATFKLPLNPVILSNNADTGYGFEVTPTSLVINGVASSDLVAFYALGYGGGFGFFSSPSTSDLDATGLQFYSGSESSPTMLGPSLLTLPAVLIDFDNTLITYTVTINEQTGNVRRPGSPEERGRLPEKAQIPEPPLLVLLVSGLLCAGVGLLLRSSSGCEAALPVVEPRPTSLKTRAGADFGVRVK